MSFCKGTWNYVLLQRNMKLCPSAKEHETMSFCKGTWNYVLLQRNMKLCPSAKEHETMSFCKGTWNYVLLQRNMKLCPSAKEHETMSFCKGTWNYVLLQRDPNIYPSAKETGCRHDHICSKCLFVYLKASGNISPYVRLPSRAKQSIILKDAITFPHNDQESLYIHTEVFLSLTTVNYDSDPVLGLTFCDYKEFSWIRVRRKVEIL